MIGAGWDSPKSQTAIIFIILTFLIAYNAIVLPFQHIWQNVLEIFFFVMMWIIMIFYLSMADQDGRGCFTCLDREGLYCWFIVILGWLSIIIPCLAILGVIITTLFKPDLFSQSDQTTYSPISQTGTVVNSKQTEKKTKETLLQDFLTHSKIRESQIQVQKSSRNQGQIKTTEDFLNSLQNDHQTPKYVPLTMNADNDTSRLTDVSRVTLNQDFDDMN